MQWVLLTEEDYVTTNWSGGTTTQLAIEPQESVYANRDFLWRFSSAKVILEHSDFTPLPDYNRLIATVKGGLDMKVGDEARFSLAPYQIYSFDGAVSVESWGCCTDFNLMLRKGQCQGTLQALTLSAGSAVSWTAPVSALWLSIADKAGCHCLRITKRHRPVSFCCAGRPKISRCAWRVPRPRN